MQVPMELTFRHIGKDPAVEALIREQAHKIERFNDHVNSCSVVVERAHSSQGSADEFRVRVDLHVAGGHEIVGEDVARRELIPTAVRNAFQQAGRQLKKLSSQQRSEVKAHPEQALGGVIVKLFDDYGFIATADGREIYFNARSVVSARFDELKVGMGVAYTEEAGSEGPQASTVRVVDARGERDAGKLPPLT